MTVAFLKPETEEFYFNESVDGSTAGNKYALCPGKSEASP
jgi:hypothetical protein